MKKYSLSSVRKILLSLFVLLAAFSVCASVQAASVASTNKKADKAFNKKLTALRKNSGYSLTYAYLDLTGDGIHEAMVEHRPASEGSSRSFDIFAYQNGKVKEILSIGEYGLVKCTYYTKTKSLILYGKGHGGEWYQYYQIDSGKYKKVAAKNRVSKAAGSAFTGPWLYTRGKNNKETSKTKFTSLTEKLQKGKKKTFKAWKTFD